MLHRMPDIRVLRTDPPPLRPRCLRQAAQLPQHKQEVPFSWKQLRPLDGYVQNTFFSDMRPEGLVLSPTADPQVPGLSVQMRFEERTDLSYRHGDAPLRVFPREHARFGLRREHHTLHGDGVG